MVLKSGHRFHLMNVYVIHRTLLVPLVNNLTIYELGGELSSPASHMQEYPRRQNKTKLNYEALCITFTACKINNPIKPQTVLKFTSTAVLENPDI